MLKVYLVENLDCANCAAKIEQKIRAIPGVEEASITFATRQLRVQAENPDELLSAMLAAARTIEADAAIVPREKHSRHEHHSHDHHGEDHACGCGHHHHEEDHACGCGHHHEEGHGCGCGHHHEEGHACCCGHHHEENEEHSHGDGELKTILAGTALFAVGLLLDKLVPSLPLGLIAYLAAYLVLGWEVLKTALRNLVRGQVFDENFLMSLATVGAFAIGEFPEAVGVMLFYRVGEYFEHKAVERSRSQIMEAVDLRPEVVNRVEGDTVTVIPAEDAHAGDLLMVRPGDRIPLDGVVVQGESRVDTAPITGEPVPLSVKPGSAVTSGCVNTTGQLTVRVEKELSESMVTRILNSVENAAAGKPKMDRFITKFSRIYTPVVVLLAVCTAVIPSLIDGRWDYWVYTALSFLVMSCPCALVLSVPLTFFAGIGVGSRQGILFKGGLSMEAMADIKAVVMDKTGTITKGEFKVQKVSGGDEVLRLCAGCEQFSTHPIAQSVVSAARERGMEPPKPDAVEELPGKGIRATVNGQRILCGNAGLLRDHGVKFQETGDFGTVVYVAADDRFLGWIVISDTLKDGAKDAIRRLTDSGISTAMLTGDGELAAKKVAEQAGIETVYAKLLPGEKLERLQQLRSERGAVMFVGDGINDAPVLSGADVGAAMGSGADAAIEAADVGFMTSDVAAIPESLEIARQTRRIAVQNVVFALAVKLVVMALGLLGHASMWAAVFADSGVAMLCVLNSIRMLYGKRKKG